MAWVRDVRFVGSADGGNHESGWLNPATGEFLTDGQTGGIAPQDAPSRQVVGQRQVATSSDSAFDQQQSIYEGDVGTESWRAKIWNSTPGSATQKFDALAQAGDPVGPLVLAQWAVNSGRISPADVGRSGVYTQALQHSQSRDFGDTFHQLAPYLIAAPMGVGAAGIAAGAGASGAVAGAAGGATAGGLSSAMTGQNLGEGALVGGALGGLIGGGLDYFSGPSAPTPTGPGGLNTSGFDMAQLGTGGTGSPSGFNAASLGDPGFRGVAPAGTPLGSGYFGAENIVNAPWSGDAPTTPWGGPVNTPPTPPAPGPNPLSGILSNPAVLGMAGGALLGGLSNSGSQAGTVTVEEGLPDWLMPYAKPALDRYSTDVQNYQVDPYGVMPAAMKEFQNTVSGMYLDPSTNKWLEDSFRLGAERVKGSLSPSFGHMQAFGAHSGYNEALSRGLSDMATNLYGGNYERERNRQAQLMAAAPSFLGQASLAAFAPQQQFLSTIGGLGKKKEQPFFENPWGNIIGGGLMGSQFGNIFK